MSKSPMFSKEELQSFVKEEYGEKLLEQLVKVSILDMRWFFVGRTNFVALSKFIKNLPNKFYETTFVLLMLTRFWKKIQREIILKQLLPYLVFISVAILFFHGYLINKEQGYPENWGSDEIVTLCLAIASIFLLPYIVRTEIL